MQSGQQRFNHQTKASYDAHNCLFVHIINLIWRLSVYLQTLGGKKSILTFMSFSDPSHVSYAGSLWFTETCIPKEP